MFRGKESSNRIELSQLVQELLNFGVSGSLLLLGVGGGWMGWGVVGGASTHMHMHAHACTRTHACTCMCGKHDNFMQMAALIGFGEIPGIPYDAICVCMCLHVHAHVCMCMCVHMCRGNPLTTPHPHPPTPHPRGGISGISQNSIALELIEIFQFCLKI